MEKTVSEPVYILGTKLSLFDQTKLLKIIKKEISGQNQYLITSGNVHAYNLAFQLSWLRDFFNQADVVRLDGFGVRLGAKILGYDTPPRMTWADFGWELAEFAAANQFSLFFLGGKPGIAEMAAEKLKEKNPNLIIVGCHHGYFDKSHRASENVAVLDDIRTSSPDILLVGFGMPLQEKWIMENREKITAHVIFTVGAAFDYISGELNRPPNWMTDHGLEWLGRMLIEPTRLWKRYIIGNPLFLWRIIKQRMGILNLPE